MREPDQVPAPRQIRSHAALRGVAALMVVAYHLQFGIGPRLALETGTGLFRRSYLFVDLFFILSGFIISYVNDAERRTPITASEAGSFFRARFARLYPLHLFCLGYLVIFEVLLSLTYIAAGRDGLAGWTSGSITSLLVQIVLLNAWTPGLGGWNVPSWSISAELFAYLAFPLLVGLHSRARRPAELAMLAGAVACLLGITASRGNLDVVSGLAPLRCLAGFMLGMLIFFWRGPIARCPAAILSALQIASLGATIVLLGVSSPDPLIVPAFVVLVATTWTDAGVLPRLLGRGPFLWAGEISYSVYLNHVPLMRMFDVGWSRAVKLVDLDGDTARGIEIILVYALVLGVSHLTFNLVERPARQWLARRWLHRPAPPIAASPPAP